MFEQKYLPVSFFDELQHAEKGSCRNSYEEMIYLSQIGCWLIGLYILRKA